MRRYICFWVANQPQAWDLSRHSGSYRAVWSGSSVREKTRGMRGTELFTRGPHQDHCANPTVDLLKEWSEMFQLH